MDTLRIIELVEYQTVSLEQNDLSPHQITTIYYNYSKQINIDGPSVATKWQLNLTSLGYVGYIPIDSSLAIRMIPKLPLSNLFKMWEWAYGLRFDFLEGIMECQTIQDYFSMLARELSIRVCERARRGLYRNYMETTDNLLFVRGRIHECNITRVAPDLSLICSYENHTADIEDNQIILWTLRTIMQSDFCSESVRSKVRQSLQMIQGLMTLIPMKSTSCVGRNYNRLNQDYRQIHTICRFFLDHVGPSHKVGSQKMIPFVVNMARLYELFVAEWLKINPPAGFFARVQETLKVGDKTTMEFEFDIVLYDTITNKPVYVLDTKYKDISTDTPRPDPKDIYQIVAYATGLGIREAVLVYPKRLEKKFELPVGQIRVRAIGFALDGDLMDSGERFSKMILT